MPTLSHRLRDGNVQEMRQAPVASAQTVHARVGKDNHRVLPGLWHTEEDIAQFKKLKGEKL